MSIHEFISNQSVTPRSSFPTPGDEIIPTIQTHPPGLSQSSDVQGGRSKFLGDSNQTHPDYIEEFLMPGFRALDQSMKNYWSGLKIPTKDSMRLMQVKIAGGDRTIMAWRDMLADGRVKLPVGSLNRTSHVRDPRKFSPPYLTMARRYTSSRMDRVALVKRPVPFIVSYDFVVWAAFKRHAEYIVHQVLSRFNPLAEFRMYDEHVEGVVVLTCEGTTDASDKEIGHDQQAKVRYEFKMSAEAWLPLPETIVPTILGHTTAITEDVIGTKLLSTLGINQV